MKTHLILGLKWEKKPDYEGRMFLTDFTEAKAREVVDDVKAELPRLKLLSGDYSAIGAGAVRRLQKIANDNLELFVYGIKASLTEHEYSLLDEAGRGAIVGLIADTIDQHPEKCMPLLKHMLKIWPHTRSWSVVNGVLARVYGQIACGDEECIEIVSRGILRDASNWEAAMNAMMNRAMRFPHETLKQFEAVFAFMAIYGENMRGKHGIQLRSTIYSYRNSAMRLAFEAQPEEVQSRLREMREKQLADAKPMLAATRAMEPKLGSESCFPEVEAFLRQGREDDARACLSEKFSVWKENGWAELACPETIDLLADHVLASGYSFNDRQQLVYQLSKLLRMNRNREEANAVSQRAYHLLSTFSVDSDSDAELVLAECAKFMARGDSSYRTLPVTDELFAELRALIQRHAGMEVYARGQVDGSEKQRGIWGYLLHNYNLHPLFHAVIERLLLETTLDNPESVRLVYKTIAATYGPARQEVRVLDEAVPNEHIAEHVNAIMAYNAGVFRRNRDYMHEVLPSIVDALDKILTQRTYDRYYRDIVTLLNVYCAALSKEDQRRERAVVNTAQKWARDFCPGIVFMID